MNLLRQELNQSKSQNVAGQRMLEEVQGRLQHDLSGAQARLQQEMDAHQRDVTHMQGQLQFQITHAGTLQVFNISSWTMNTIVILLNQTSKEVKVIES